MLKIEICGNYSDFLQFPNLKKNSFRGKYSRKYCMQRLDLGIQKKHTNERDTTSLI